MTGVGAAPVVTTPNEAPAAAPGGTVELKVTETNGSVTYQWQRNGTDLIGASTSTPTLNASDCRPPASTPTR